MKRKTIFVTGFASVVVFVGGAQARVQNPSAQIFPEAAAHIVRARNLVPPSGTTAAPASAEEANAESTAVTPVPPSQTHTLASKPSSAGKRDPFRSVIQSREGSSSVSECATGKKCLVANLVMLKGVVKGPEGMLAVVENQHHKSYFLREKDPIFNGQVVRITSDSIVFREKVVDKAGRTSTREVVKHIAGGKTEGRS
jgi:hypothetical protein